MQLNLENLNQTIRLAVELEAFYKAERRIDTGKGHSRVTKMIDGNTETNEQMLSMMKSFQEKIETLQREMDSFKKELIGGRKKEHRPGLTKRHKVFQLSQVRTFQK